MSKLLTVAIGTLLLILGAISMVTPIPGSTFFLASGMTLLICASPWFRACLSWSRRRAKLFNKMMTWLENHTGKKIGGVLKTTRPSVNPPEPLQLE
ncbi:MAG: hypothetical protein HQ519_01380 [Planctomycetes bacterium]|nr:hypothetical protein [Planctomycetota bacterium]